MVDIADRSYARTVYLCDKCGRQGRPDDDGWKYWLVSSPPLAVKFMVRCPRHVTEWAMRQAGVPRNTTFRRWLKEAHERDTAPRPFPEHIHPYPLEGPFK